MNTSIALFRGINVGGKGKLPMKERTIGAAVRKSHGFEPAVLLIDPGRLAKAMRANPFPEGEAAGNTLHLGFLASAPPHPDLAGIERLRAASERFQLKNDVFYLHAPDGIGRSRLANGAERLLGVPMTSRNWNTLSTLREMAPAEGGGT